MRDGLHLRDHVLEEQERAVVDAGQPGPEPAISWHGGTAPTRIQRRLVLDDAELAGLASAIGEHIGDVGLQHLAQSELFTAVVRAGAR